MLISYASDPLKSKGRLYNEEATPYRNEFERDRDRIIHSNAFKRLQYKTQVFVNHEGDHYRNRLTHSIEVSTVARSIAKTLNLCDDLAESVALAHDLGHTPFGHAGEEALNECMKDYGGFSHNTHSLKILTTLEHKYAAYKGLNLTWEVLEGIVKHNGPLIGMVDPVIIEFNKQFDLDLGSYPSAEAQLASLSDDIAYISHDIEDSIRAGIINLKNLEEIPEIFKYILEVNDKYKSLDDSRLIYEVVRKLMHYLVKDLLSQTQSNINKYKIELPEDIRLLQKGVVDFSEAVREEITKIKSFLFSKVYRHPEVTSMTLRCQKIIKKLFRLYMDNIDLLPFSWRENIDSLDEKSKAGIIADYIAGMTDRFAIKEYQSFYNLNFSKI